mmetsp:Transcript_14885/g.32149  ORF Transcript_14885/g.32149 Transcript_14885/m.32149 type:complete len:362 (-) Transcript_14885:44-1129(-)
MGFLLECKYYCYWLLAFVILLDYHWPWTPPWNHWPRNPFTDLACASPEGLAAESNTSSGLKVILASVGQTGTTSVLAALSELGMRTYHIEEQVLFSRPMLRVNATSDVMARHFSRCRVDAVALEPLVDMLPALLQTSPDAKVVLTWRDFASWHKSTTKGGKKDVLWHIFMCMFFASSARALPWISLLDMTTGSVTQLLKEGKPFAEAGQASLAEQLAFYSFAKFPYGDPVNQVIFRGTNSITFGQDYAQIETGYKASVNLIKQLVPPERLLVFDVKVHGWDDLTNFLEFPAKEKGRPFPHPRSKNSWTNDTLWEYAPVWQQLAVVAILGGLHIVNFAIVRCLCKLGRRLYLRYFKSESARD